MEYKRVRQPKISEVIQERLEKMILEGVLKPGQKLPPERELAAQFEVSRPSVREAIQKLEARGLIDRRQGGGNYISDELGASYTEPLFELIQQDPESRYDMLEFRHALEGVAAYYAALRGTDADREIIVRRYDDWLALQQQNELELEALADAEFHLSIAEAAHNVVLLHTMRALFTVQKENIVSNLHYLYKEDMTREKREKIQAQHYQLMRMVVDRKAPEARDAAHEHLAFVEEILLEHSKAQSRTKRSLRRLQIMDGLN